MKNRRLIAVVYLLISSIAISLYTSCHNRKEGNAGTPANNRNAPKSDSETTDSAQLIGHFGNEEKMLAPHDKEFQLVINIVSLQDSFVRSGNDTCNNSPQGSSKDCSTNYCGDPDCIRKILCCHRINEEIFDDLTQKENYGHATFTAARIHKVVDGADCKTQVIKFRTILGYYHVSCVKDTTHHFDGRKSYYSVALLQGIMADKVDSITLFGGLTSVANAKQYKIVPFKVYYTGGEVEYFDVSDTQP